MWARRERRERGFDLGKQGIDRGAIWQPREVDGRRSALVGRAEPKLVGRDGTDLGDLYRGGNRGPQGLERLDCCDKVLAAHEVLGLQLVAAARRVVHPE